MATRTDLATFQGNYEVKNGYIGDETVLNAAPDKLKKELNALWTITSLGHIEGAYPGTVTGDGKSVVLELDGSTPYEPNRNFYVAGTFGDFA